MALETHFFFPPKIQVLAVTIPETPAKDHESAPLKCVLENNLNYPERNLDDGMDEALLLADLAADKNTDKIKTTLQKQKIAYLQEAQLKTMSKHLPQLGESVQQPRLVILQQKWQR